MPFGSMMNAYGQVNKGKGISVEDFKRTAKELFEFSQELSEEAYEYAEKYENKDKGKRKKTLDDIDEIG